jgi:hypothetical protein
MINADFSTITAHKFSLKQINQLEIALLSALKFDVKVRLLRILARVSRRRGFAGVRAALQA